jgi:hypothetical protein
MLYSPLLPVHIAAGVVGIVSGKVFPSFISQSNALVIPAVLPLLLLIFWMFRVRFTNAYRKKAATAL